MLLIEILRLRRARSKQSHAFYVRSYLIVYKTDIQHLWTEVAPPYCSKFAPYSTTRWKLCHWFLLFRNQPFGTIITNVAL